MFAEFLGMTGPELKDYSYFLGGIIVLVLQYLNNRKMNTVSTDIRKVEVATNSMKDQLVLKTEQEALSRGGVQERERADVRQEKAEDRQVTSTVQQNLTKVLDKQTEVLEKQEILPEKTATKVVEKLEELPKKDDDSPKGKAK